MNLIFKKLYKSLIRLKLSLDCATGRCLKRLDRAHKSIDIEDIKSGMLSFKKTFSKPLIIEILIVKGVNDGEEEIKALNKYLLTLKPTRIDIGTIDRPPAYYVEPLSYEDLRSISLKFDATLPVYIASRKLVSMQPSNYTNDDIIETIKKRPLTLDDIEVLFDRESKEKLESLVNKEVIKIENCAGYDFFVKNT